MTRLNDIRLSDNFKLYEFECPCCKVVKIDSKLLQAVQILRWLIGRPIIFNSAYRCIKHNRKVGGHQNSAHLYGQAVDISVGQEGAFLFERVAKKCGFTRVLHYPTRNFYHLGVNYVAETDSLDSEKEVWPNNK